MPYPRGNRFIPGPAGPIEAIEKRAEGAGRWVVISHGHPLHGGVMHFKVLYRLANVLHAAGYNVLRYNFRGVGNSAGSFGEGQGEIDDLRAILDHLQGEAPEGFLLGGFSFGAWVSARVGCPDPRVRRLLFLGIAGGFFDLDFRASCDKPAAVVQGDRDQFGDWSRVEELVAAMPRARLYRVPGADHFFTERMAELEEVLSRAVRELENLS